MRKPSETSKLIALIQEGQPLVEHELVGRWNDRVTFLVRRGMSEELRKRITPEDITQEFWLEFFSKSVQKLTESQVCNFDKWMIRVIKHHILAQVAYFKAEKRDPKREGSNEPNDTSGDLRRPPVRKPEDIVIEDEDKELLHRGLDQLKEKNDSYYQVIIEREVHGDSWKKIGEARKKTITPDAARKLFERAVCSLTIVVRGLAEEG